MNVLIIEDDINKSRQLADCVRQAIPDVNLIERRSFQSSLREIVNARPDAVILDMTLPTYDIVQGETGGRIRTYGGREILDEISRRGLTIPVVVVTQFESFGEGADRLGLNELSAQLRKEYPASYRGTVYYHPSQSDWRANLRRHLSDGVQVQGGS